MDTYDATLRVHINNLEELCVELVLSHKADKPWMATAILEDKKKVTAEGETMLAAAAALLAELRN